jgi:hypothetical protein
MRAFLRLCIAVLMIAAVAGCAGTHQVRYVYQDGEFGVVGMPENTDRWPTHYRRQAEKLMTQHFPEGHEIVRAEEVVEGSRTLTIQGTNSAELLPQLPAAVVALGKLGRSASRSQADQLKITECRIVYRKSEHPTDHVSYTQRPSLTPTRYVDPNDAERRKDAPEKGEKKANEPKLDPATVPAGPAGASPSAAPQGPAGQASPALPAQDGEVIIPARAGKTQRFSVNPELL